VITVLQPRDAVIAKARRAAPDGNIAVPKSESWSGSTRRCGTSGGAPGGGTTGEQCSPDAAEIRGPAERLVKAAFRAVAGGCDEARMARVRQTLEPALHEISELGRRE